MTDPAFAFAVTQPGSEAALKSEVARVAPELKPAFSRPGFVTFRLPERHARFELHAAFARTWGHSLGKLDGAGPAELARAFWRTLAARLGNERAAEVRHVHVWRRAAEPLGDPRAGDETDETGAVDAAARAIAERPSDVCAGAPPAINAPAAAGDLVADCVLVEPEEWWLGWHRAASPETRWPGGVPPIPPRADAISRAYFKLVEALAWSELPLRAGDRCIELGSAPGGSCLALLERGCTVVGVDPAEMDARVLADPRFTHIRARAKDVDRAVFRGCRWLTADINLPPTYTLDTVEAVVGAAGVAPEGLVLTLKLTDRAHAARLPAFVERIRGFGYGRVRARQLAFNRREVCVVAARS